jgi:transposase
MRERLTLTTKEQQRIEVVSRWLAGILTTGEATVLLGCSERTAWRLRSAMLRDGAAGLTHGNRGRPSARRLPDDVVDRILVLATTEYGGFNDSHLAEVLAEDHDVVISRSALRRLLRSRGIASPRRRRTARYRSRRERMAQEGLMVQVDGSRHDWLEGRGPWLTLVGGIDDASGKMVGAVFRPAEDGVGYLTMLRDMARRYGLPASIYRDGSSVFAPTGGSPQERDEATQIARALAELGITSLHAGSPQAKGRIERVAGDIPGSPLLGAAPPSGQRHRRRERRAARLPAPLQPPVRGADGQPGVRLASAAGRPRPRPRARLPLASGRGLRQLRPPPGCAPPAASCGRRPVARWTAGGGRAATRRSTARPRRRADPRGGPGSPRATPAARAQDPRPEGADARTDQSERRVSSEG